MKIYLALLLAAVLLFGCTGSGNQGYKANDNSISNAAGGGSGSMQTGGGAAAAGGATATGNVVEINMTAKDWAFDPGTITVHKGDTVKLHITSLDVTHGFALPDYGINEQIVPGQTTDITFVADHSGTFGFRCSVMCGEGHRQMTGTLVVQ